MRKIWSAAARHGVLVAAAALLVTTPAGAQEEPDELTRMVAAYELTLPRVEAYGAVHAGLAAWATANPAEAEQLRARLPRGRATIAQSVAHLAGEPVIRTILERHNLTGLDFVLIPVAVLQARIAALGEAQGRTFPTDRINPANTAFARANAARLDSIMGKVAIDRATAFGGR